MENKIIAILAVAFILSMGMIVAPVYAVPHGDHDDNRNADNGQLGPGGDPDNDGVKNKDDNCDSVSNSDQTDTDLDGIGDACDSTPEGPDSDGDGVPDLFDNCPDVAGDGEDGCPIVIPPADSDGDGVTDDLDACPDEFGTGSDGCPVVIPPTDTDEDGISDDLDNCPSVSNAEQTDTDEDGIGDVCDETPNGTGGDDDGSGSGNQTGGGDDGSGSGSGSGDDESGDNGGGSGNQTGSGGDDDTGSDDEGTGDNGGNVTVTSHRHHGHNHEFAKLIYLRNVCETAPYNASDCQAYLDYLAYYKGKHLSYSPDSYDILFANNAINPPTDEPQTVYAWFAPCAHTLTDLVNWFLGTLKCD